MSWTWKLLVRRPGRLAGTAVGVALAVALLASIGAFLAASKSTMTRRAVADVPVDWQVEVQPGANPTDVQAAVQAASGVTGTGLVEFAQPSGVHATTGDSTQTTGAATVVGLPDNYQTDFGGTVRVLSGSGTGVLVAQQTAANLHVGPGDVVGIDDGSPGGARLTVDGVVEVLKADSLFQKVGAPPGSQPQAPPDNVVLVPAATWHRLFSNPGFTGPERTQVHARLTHDLPADPAAAFSAVTGRARNLEVSLAGAGLVGDNLAATLDAARGDALYAQMLFLFLGLPGAMLAGILTAAVSAAGAPRRQAEQALLRARGATTRQLVRLGLAEAMLVGLAGALVGLLAAAVIGRAAFGTAQFGVSAQGGLVWSAGAAIIGLLIALLSVAVPAGRQARHDNVAARRRVVAPTRRATWMRYGVDVALLSGAAVVFWLTGRPGYHLILVPEGVPSISVNYWAFAGPAMLWVGAGLLAWRLSEAILIRRSTISALARPLAGRLTPTVAASMARQRRLLSRSLVLVALTISFAASTAVFNATYGHQSRVDALLTNGADVTVTEPPTAQVGPGRSDALRAVPGVRQVEPVQHRFAYVGADLQDLFGVRPDTIVAATKLQDAYFTGGSANALIGLLGSTPDSILVSQETVKDYQLRPGDLVNLRLPDARTKQTVTVPFHYVGIAREFPTAPRDSFLVANADYLTRMTGSDAVGAFLIDTSGRTPASVAHDVAAVVGTSATVTDLDTSRHVVGSSLTAVDLNALTKVELGFALVLALAATGLMLALGLAERRRSFAIVSALGANRTQLRSFVVVEAAFVVLGGLIAGAAGAWFLAHMLVTVLTGVFDPAPDHLAVPWAYLGGLASAALAGTGAAVAVSVRSIRTTAISALRDL